MYTIGQPANGVRAGGRGHIHSEQRYAGQTVIFFFVLYVEEKRWECKPNVSTGADNAYYRGREIFHSTQRYAGQTEIFFFGGGEGWECKLNVSTVADNAYYTSTNCHH